jgi:Glycosyltransferase family 87
MTDTAESALMIWLRRLGRNRLLNWVAVVLVVVCVARIAQVLPARSIRDDFAHYYVATHLYMAGADVYRTDLWPLYRQYGVEPPGDVPDVTAPSPPAFLWMFQPVASLPLRSAFLAWLAVEVVSLGAIGGMTRHLLRDRLTARGWWWVVAGTLMSGVLYWHFYLSQVSLLLAALVLAGYAALQAGRPVAACLAVATAGLLKLFPFALLPWFIWRGGGTMRQQSARAAIVLAFVAGMVWWTGVGMWRDYWVEALPVLRAGSLNRTFNFTLPSFVANLGLAGFGFAAPVETVRLWASFGTVAGVAVLVGAYCVAVRQRADTELEFGLLTVAMLAGSLRSWGHYFVVLIFPLAALGVRLAARPTPGRVLWFGATLAALNVQGTWQTPFLDQHLYLELLVNYVPFYGLVSLGVLCVRELSRGRNVSGA